MSSSAPRVKRTYGTQNGKARFPRASSSDTSSSSPTRGTNLILKRKRPLAEIFPNVEPPKKRPVLKRPIAAEKKKSAMTQLHFIIDQSTLRTCPLCDLSYTRGAPDDESLHKLHCARVQKGMEWGKSEEKERCKSGIDVTVVEDEVILKEGGKGRVIAVKASTKGQLGNKVSAYLKTVNLALSAPDISPAALESAKAYLFLMKTPNSSQEKIVGCVVAQRISFAMQIATQGEYSDAKCTPTPLIHVEGNLYCKPQRIPTPMGIPRLFVSSMHRRKGIAQALLSAAASTFIHGCELDPSRGEVAFSQPTSMGRAVMETWGKGGVRVYEESV